MRTTYKYDAKTGPMMPSAPQPAGTCNMLMNALAGFGAGGKSGPTEPDLTNLTAWWRADDVVLDGSNNVQTLNDKSGNGRDVFVSSGNRPSIGTLGGQDALDFDGTEYIATSYSNGTLINVSLGTVFVVFNARTISLNVDNKGKSDPIFTFGSRYGGMYSDNGGDLRVYNFDGNYQSKRTEGISINSDYGAIWTLDSAGAGISGKVTGFSEVSKSCGDTTYSGADLIIGDYANGGNDPFDGLIAEILFYSDDHSDNQKTRDYLAARYGLTW